jgi:hypothetical protein
LCRLWDTGCCPILIFIDTAGHTPIGYLATLSGMALPDVGG